MFVIPALYKYSTDGFNLTGKRIGLMTSFQNIRPQFWSTKTFTISHLN
jgi:hypothetical protein